MNHSSKKALQYLAGSERLESVQLAELERQAEETPFFAVSQLLLLRKLKEGNKEDYERQLQKTAVYFPNPFWLSYQLQDESAFKHEEESSVEPPVEQPIFELTTTGIKELDEVETELARPVEMAPETEAFLDEIATENTSEIEEETPEIKKAAPIEAQEEMDEHEKMFQNIKAMLDATSEEADAETNATNVPIDPYYTIDYFASQGIKLDLDYNPQDQLGKQVKKFTQWLKHMKKLGPEDATEVISRTEADADIQKIADSSNTAKEVVTEAMAMVLEKQGKKEKAIELYNKLSFLNPHKRGYFADKIKNLKGT